MSGASKPAPLTCSTSEARVSVAWMAFAKQLASEIFIPKSIRSYFIPIELTLYVTSSWRAREVSGGGAVGDGRLPPVERLLSIEMQSYVHKECLSLLSTYIRGIANIWYSCRCRGGRVVIGRHAIGVIPLG